MEGGASYGSFNGGQGANSGLHNHNSAAAAAAAAASGSESVQGQQAAAAAAQPPAIREQDRFMPIANVIRIMRKVLPTHAKISDDAKETIQECVSEYISFITSEANERCQREQRKTITAEDVLWAMSKLGFDDYIEPLSVYLHRYRELEGDHRGSIRGDPLPILKHRQQHQHQHHHHHQHHEAQQLYVAAPPPPQQQSYMGPPQHGMHPHYGGMYGDGMGGYYGMYGGGGGGSGGGGGGGDHGHGGGASSSMGPNNFEHHPYAYK